MTTGRKPASSRNAAPRRRKSAQQRHTSQQRRSTRWLRWIGGGAAAVLYVWLFYSFFVSPTGFRWRALYSDTHYPEGYEIHGIDISHYQGEIDWNQLRHARVDGCPIRFVVIKSTEGATHKDERFDDNFREALEHGFVRGAYHFWSTRSSAREQARFFIDNVDLQEGDLPPVLDVERIPNGMSTDEFQLELLTWLHIVEDRYGAKPIIYTYNKFKETYLSAPVFDDYPYWIAHYYVERVEYAGEWRFWQHTDAGHLPGITGYVDLDVYNGSFYDMMMLTIGSQNNDE